MDWQNIKNRLKKLFSGAIFALAIASGVVLGFWGGYYFRNIEEKPNPIKFINKSEVNISMDDSGNIIIIDKKSGSFVIYSDSVSKTIFKLNLKEITGGKE